MSAISKISPFLWYESRAEEAANFYVSTFKNSRILSVWKVPSGPAAGGSVVEFELEGQKITALDGGPMFSFTPAISFVVSCDSQEEIDYFWEKLSENGMKAQCGWLNDQFGLSNGRMSQSGIPRTMSGGATSVRSTCWSICTLKR